MGKNDLWIAATASVLNAALLAIDHDFDHLSSVFLKVIYIDQKLTASDDAAWPVQQLSRGTDEERPRSWRSLKYSLNVLRN